MVVGAGKDADAAGNLGAVGVGDPGSDVFVGARSK